MLKGAIQTENVLKGVIKTGSELKGVILTGTIRGGNTDWDRLCYSRSGSQGRCGG